MEVRKLPVHLLLLACAFTFACTITQTMQTPVVEPFAEGTVTPGMDVSITTSPLNAIIPESLASAATTTITTEVEFPYINPSIGDMPPHSKYVLENYLLVGSIHAPHILIFNSKEYAAYSELTGEIISSFQSYDPASNSPVPEVLYTGMITAQQQPIAFQNGKGLRYLTQAGQAPVPINNSGLFYYFQGLSEDGNYYISAIFPTSAPFLVANDDPTSPLPVDGIPFDFDNFDALPKYLNAMNQKLDSSSLDDFTPSLKILDSFVESFLITS